MTQIGIRRPLEAGFEEALERVAAALQSEGFGVLTEIDVQKTLREKLGADFRRYRILGACNPPLAYQALQTELDVGLGMPCNVIVYETAGGKSVVVAVDPLQTLASLGAPGLEPVAREVRRKLERVLDRLNQPPNA
ncbi:MAG TPA: DUF302 domain-containing protein [Candidatus Saccharimonadales bacterium]|nr:DUF302 domain-containing protein [Candidatus Saccharimonadales bacterium]